MFSMITRRTFFRRSALFGIGGLSIRPQGLLEKASSRQGGGLPVVIASANGERAVDRAYHLIKERGADTLDAAIAGVNINEDDPEDNSVGYGGLPNEEGVVELDASVMHGPSRRAGAVAGLREIKNPSNVAYAVLKRTDHLLLVGEGALRFAVAHGFKRENLLTEKSRVAWLAWKETMSNVDGWGPGLATPSEELKPEEKRLQGLLREIGRLDLQEWVLSVVRNPPQGTINCLAVNERADISGVTTTSGLAWKIPGRVGDSPLIGCGLYVDNDIGAAGSTGRGEEAIKTNASHTIVEMMRVGMKPADAALEAVRRVARNYNNDKRLLSRFNIIFYAVNKKGEHGGAALWNGSWRIDTFRKSQYAVADSSGVRLVDTGYLFERESPK